MHHSYPPSCYSLVDVRARGKAVSESERESSESGARARDKVGNPPFVPTSFMQCC